MVSSFLFCRNHLTSSLCQIQVWIGLSYEWLCRANGSCKTSLTILILHRKMEFSVVVSLFFYFIFALFRFALLSLVDKTNLIVGLMFANFPQGLAFLPESN